ncbi:hypothetical protein A2Z00_03485 [Candidatus Gottesmanbacteria bacterium RBG_13_45_10]|uniref:Uncharacterized protein n=1 Tax=Candidatus Gottesmanbacteria bacterium RBG_13_45_10 TaxID=1798370 RepID=A0A1F5ZGP4_9BACT|nr:MAG: hypothetical protein A2Z00_03485 [Candidatus Gottesmanbacteria bacterium RBG_13_45_10]
MAAFIDALTDPELYGQDGVILSLEPLGALIQPLHFREQLAVAAIYGDANIAMYVNPKYYRPLAWRIRFIDDGGATKLATRYSHVGTVDQEMVERLHIEFGEGGREIASVSPEAITSAIRRPEGDTNATMDPNATVQFLSDKTPDVHLDILEDLLAINPAASLAHIIIHDPSKLVNTLMNKAIAAKAGLRRKLPQAFLAGLPRPKFMLDTMRMANGSSATTPSKMQHMAVNNLIHPHGIGELVAPGIGAVIAAITYMYQ